MQPQQPLGQPLPFLQAPAQPQRLPQPRQEAVATGVCMRVYICLDACMRVCVCVCVCAPIHVDVSCVFMCVCVSVIALLCVCVSVHPYMWVYHVCACLRCVCAFKCACFCALMCCGCARVWLQASIRIGVCRLFCRCVSYTHKAHLL